MELEVLLFASVAEAAGTRKLRLPLCDGDTVERVRDRLMAAYPALDRFRASLLFALDEEYVPLDHPVPPGSTLAIIPPVSGG